VDLGDLYFTNGAYDPLDAVDFDSNTYIARQYKLAGFKVRSSGALPRPALTIDNVDRYWFSPVATCDQLIGASITYREVYRQNLDDGSDPDTTQIIEQTEWVIRQLKSINSDVAVFLLATPLDVEQATFGRRMMKHVCPRKYRTPKGTADTFYDINDSTVNVDCPYVGSSYFKKDGSAGGDWSEDDCGQRLSDCKLRFGATAELPYKGFPAIGDPRA
tara:strand:+ start:38047 stop:38697 length:651 start_codon:yes stop_codon:yes gene_type:complete